MRLKVKIGILTVVLVVLGLGLFLGFGRAGADSTLILYPNGTGYATAAKIYQYPNSSSHWDKVDDPAGSPDDASTYLYSNWSCNEPGNIQEGYALSDPGSQLGTINSVTVTGRFRETSGTCSSECPKLGLRLGSTNSWSSTIWTTTSWANYTVTISRPGGGSWAWSDLADMQVILQLGRLGASCYENVTQIYVTVNYTPSLNIATVDAVAKGSIATIDGVTFSTIKTLDGIQ